MSEKPISPLRRRMIEDMTVRNFVEKTHNDYIRHVRTFTAFLGRAPDTAAPEDLRLFQLHQTQAGVRAPSINGSVAALRFFFTVTLDRPEMARHLTFVREPRKIPVILSLEEIARLLEAAPGPKYKAALSAAYGAGLRVSEVVALKVVARARGAYMRDKRKEAEFEKDFRKDAIADRVERRQNASHQRALARKAASKNSR